MNPFLILSPVAGFVMGILFFGGLWFTVRRGLASQNQVLWFLGSLLLRTGIVLVGFYFFGAGHWERMLLCLLGFIIARIVVKRWVSLPQKYQNQSPQKVNYAS